MNAEKLSLQDTVLDMLRKERAMVAVYLINGIRLLGKVEAFDAYVIVLRSEVTQLVYKHAIATVVPSDASGAFEDDDSQTRYLKEDRPSRNNTILSRKRSREVA